ncbi:phosphonate C-P lyase system protein PhnH [Bradyrhizobium neotropicale]|uniref:phosphonate C-P lyase system protein PhnH n=1 Tax=Bradyrhizobium neotropicale TaxID=1497615 RepID=UPI001AD6A62E|nr:phosphonate C-P lyase system protein PhnH [Bradyrhizobium neotropicale]MBO4222274.1 phosphonate C-P lyase system protein PhnH [Bradyrhizobium neotropicale]
MTAIAELPPGFSDKVLPAQATFRSVMNAMARPGKVERIAASAGAPDGVMHGAAAIALTLFDHDTPVWLDGAMSTPDVAKWLKFHTGAPIIGDPAIASFALIGDPENLPALDRFALGSGEYPDRSTTLILQIGSLSQGTAYELRGPGIDGSAVLTATIEPHDLFDQLAVNATLFPRGIDVVLVAGDEIVAIPRTTRLAHGKD